jgi:basic membrane lipoprotein Med (substrate-binding protein (PBP1-ABC) superfamily)/DNA-binding SARP family transcriptional activator
VLGLLEARVGDHTLALGSTKQRSVLGALLLRAGEVVPIDQLVDEAWEGSPPPSAVPSLEAYISRLRHVLRPYPTSIQRRGRGYVVELGGASLDSQVFKRLLDETENAAAAEEHERVVDLATSALGLWRGAPLADLQLEGASRIEAERLTELRLHALELRFDAELQLGRHEAVGRELPRLVEEHPYRERFACQLMVALYRSGRQAEALTVYERVRRRLQDDLGLQPGVELRELSGKIVRQEPELTASGRSSPSRGPERRGRKRMASVLAVALAGVAAATLVVGLLVGTSGSNADEGGTRVALILPAQPRAGREDTFGAPLVDGLLRAERDYELETETIALEAFGLEGDKLYSEPTDGRRLANTIRDGAFDLVLIAGGAGASFLAGEAPKHPHTRFAWIDFCCLEDLGLEDSPNATTMSFDDEEAGYVVGYLAGLMEARRFRPGRTVVSGIGGLPIPAVVALLDGFERGVRRTLPDADVLVDYAGSFVEQSTCARIAGRQIDEGATTVFPAAGTCSLGALEAAGIRGVWGIGVDADRSRLGSHVLASTVKRMDRAVELAVRWFVQGTFPAGEDIVLGLEDDAVGVAGISPEVPAEIRSKIARLAASFRQEKTARERRIVMDATIRISRLS